MSQQANALSQAELKNTLRYNPKTGIFTWINVSKYHPEKQNAIAGCTRSSNGKDYIVIRVNGKDYRAHRLAFLYMSGFIPDLIDHANGNGLDNRWANLSQRSIFENAQNHTKTLNSSGLPCGVRLLKSGRFQARITAFKKVFYLGTYETAKEASIVYERKKRKLHYCPARSV